MTNISGNLDVPPMTYQNAIEKLENSEWSNLQFFKSGAARETAARVDMRVSAGAQVLPSAGNVFRALELTQPDQVRAVILGQDPYPTPGNAHGLAFSIENPEHRVPPSLRTIFASLKADLNIEPPDHGDLSRWAGSGILLLNVTLSVEAGKANSHKNIGWAELAAEIMQYLNARTTPVVFMLWGNFAHKAGSDLDASRHCIVKTVHPSPLAHGGGALHKFVKARPFTQAQEWLSIHGLPPIDWRL